YCRCMKSSKQTVKYIAPDQKGCSIMQPAALRSSLGRETPRQRLDVLFPSSRPHAAARSSLHLSLHDGCGAGVKEVRLLQLLEAGDRLLKGVVLDGLLRQRGRVVLSHGLGRGRKHSLVPEKLPVPHVLVAYQHERSYE
ncbi:hypothetical protein ACJX0J_034501, partial [Zea mays]